MVTPGSITVSVGILHVAGMGRRDGALLQSAFTQRLGSLLAAQGVPPHWQGGLPPLRLPDRAFTRPDRLGVALADAMFEAPHV
jgi:hypothetical protein